MNNKKTAIVSGISGMVGAHAAQKFLNLGLEVFGLLRPASARDLWRLSELGISNHPSLKLIEGDLTDYTSIERHLRSIKPDYFFNFAAQSHVKVSFEHPILTADITGLGVLRILEAIRELNLSNKTRFVQASSSEQFGGVQNARADGFLDETVRFEAHSPYAASKIFAHNIVGNYRSSYKLFASTYIGFNHESHLRSDTFLTRKVTKAVANIKHGVQKELRLGNLHSFRDWSDTTDIVEGAWLIANHTKPDDFILASGETHSVEEFVQLAFAQVGLDYKEYVVIDPAFFRPHEVDVLLGDATKAKTELNWTPKVSFSDLVHKMVSADLERVRKELGKAK